MAGTSASPFHVGLTPARVIDCALELTGESHLFGWSIRDLAGRLGVAPSVVYHHVGGRDLLARHVVDRVVSRMVAPSAALPWQDWFRALLHDAYDVVTPYPGVAKWLLMHGPTFDSVVSIVDLGTHKLAEAGFGERTAQAYSALLNNAMLTVGMGDDRLVHEEDGPRDHATMMTEFRAMSTTSPGFTALAEQMMPAFVVGGDEAARGRRAYYDFVVETTVAGLAVLLAASDPAHDATGSTEFDTAH